MSAESVHADPLGLAYVRLAFHIDRHVPGFIDAAFAPPEWKAQVEAEGDIPPGELHRQAEALLPEVSGLPDELRREWLAKHITAMIATLRRLEGERLSFEEEVRLVYDIHPSWVDEREFEDALRVIDDLLPGPQPLAERMEAMHKQLEIPPDKILPIASQCCEEIRRRTRQLFELPEGEAVSLQLVEGQPWSAYNWYLGNYRSRIDINTVLPVSAAAILTLLTHECYPGHHTEHAIKEQRLYRRLGQAEACVQLINGPECVISEGLADLGYQIIFSEQELKAWLREQVYPQAGIDPGLVARDRAIAHASRRLRALSGNAAFLLHRDGADEQAVLDYLQRYGAQTEMRARQTYRFISHPLYRSYTFNYYYGRELLGQYVEAGDPVVRFQTLLEQPLTPSRIEAWIAHAG